MNFSTKELAIIIVFCSLGAVLSVPIGHLGNYLKTIPALPLGTGQILAGLHVLTVALTTLLVRRRGTATVAAVLKGLLEAILFSFHGFTVIAMSGVQGLVLDLTLTIFGYGSLPGLMLGCGLSALSNVAYLQFFLGMNMPQWVFTYMYVSAFISGAALGGYLAHRLHRMVKTRTGL
ncbi:ECF transporter S component [Candidatus Bathyarchaeota archaeon]|nr:ECF transporter S component [Candidatus Bathyarchaeota archaeon]